MIELEHLVLDYAKLDLSLLDASTYARLTELVVVQDDEDGYAHLGTCAYSVAAARGASTTAAQYTLPWHDVAPRLCAHCEHSTSADPVRHDAVELLLQAFTPALESSEEVEYSRTRVGAALASSPVLEPLRASITAHVDALAQEHDAWVQEKGQDALDLFASWCFLKDQRPGLNHYLDQPGRAVTLEELGTKHALTDQLRAAHTTRARLDGCVLVKDHAERTDPLNLVSDYSLADALSSFSRGKRSWLLPGSLLPIAAYCASASWATVDETEDTSVLDAALLFLDEQVSLSAIEALEMARAL